MFLLKEIYTLLICTTLCMTKSDGKAKAKKFYLVDVYDNQMGK